MRNFLYRLARLFGDVDAVRRGPGPFVKRRVRRRVQRAYLRPLDRLFRR
jgi:hypothetical protein